MLKGFVSGEEKDIVRIPMKGKNLSAFDAITYLNDNAYYVSNRILDSIPEGSYTLSYFVDADPSVGSLSASIGVGSTISSYEKDIKTVNGVTAGYVSIPFSITDADAGKKLFVQFLRGGSRFTATVTVTKVMLNLGSTALPYEPYGYQEGWEVRDNDDRILWGREDELQTATGTLPFKGYGLPLKVKSLLGNAVQNGTPAPDNIIMPEMCGVRTGNLSPPLSAWEDGYVSAYTGGILSPTQSAEKTSPYIDISGITGYLYMSYETGMFPVGNDGDWWCIGFYTDGKAFISRLASVNYKHFLIPDNARYVRISFRTYGYTDNCMLSHGYDPVDYEPYGYKIPFTNSGQTIPVYLGEVPTVRRIKKLVLDGTESWSPETTNVFVIYATMPKEGYKDLICTHYGLAASYSDLTSKNNVCAVSKRPALFIKDSRFTTSADLKVYLASEYAAGHPVTIWYVLNEPETTISNEPLCKISTYADELTTIQVHGLSAPLYGIGDYKDTLNLSTGVVTRKVKKLVLTGEETGWSENTSGTNTFRGALTLPYENMTGAGGFCSHNIYKISGISADEEACSCYRGALYFRISKTIASNVASFKQWLSQQYAAGHPVIIWYVLSTSETETVTVPTGMTGEIEGYLTQVSTPTPTNRSVPKWNGVEETGGTYAVTVYTPSEIPTTTGENTLTVGTTLAPSNLTVKGHIKELT